jgi:soluble lytic murein transglycosylase
MVEAPHVLWRIAYPDPWPELTVQATAPVDLDPALLLALMRQESRFEPTAQSSAGARGLAQVMPGTGEGIAAQLREPGFSHDDLFRPSVSLRFGAHYIAQQLDRFDGQPGPALAAYNGGPRNAARWWPEARGDVDRLVETIDFRETRAYLRLVLTNYAIYEAIQAGQ